MKTYLDIHDNDIIEINTVKTLLCCLLEHEIAAVDSGYSLDSGRYRIRLSAVGIKIRDTERPEIMSYYAAYENIDRIGLEFINESSAALGLYIELGDGSCTFFPDESGIEIKGKALDMINYARKAVSLSNELFCNEEEEW